MTSPHDEDEWFVQTRELVDITLASAEQLDAKAVENSVFNWIWSRRTRLPWFSKLDDRARDNARYWAELATTPELEAYMLAASMKLEGSKSTFHRRHIKRLIASLWKRMWPEDQAAFIEWAKENGNGRKN